MEKIHPTKHADFKVYGSKNKQKRIRSQIRLCADYAVCNQRGRCVDATYTTDAVARFVNDSRSKSFHNNSKIKGNQIFGLKATKTIPPNNEIFTSYGREYWQ